MKHGIVKGMVTGALVGAGALWAMNSMTKAQRRTLQRFASDTASKVMKKTNELLK